jgi:hypothetical protein
VPQQQQQQQHAFGLPGMGAAPLAAAAAGQWPTLQPHPGLHGSYNLFHAHTLANAMHPALEQHPMVAMAAAAAAAQAAAPAGAAEARPDSRRVRRRRPAARRSLLNLFDAAAASEEQSELSDASDSEWAPGVGG